MTNGPRPDPRPTSATDAQAGPPPRQRAAAGVATLDDSLAVSLAAIDDAQAEIDGAKQRLERARRDFARRLGEVYADDSEPPAELVRDLYWNRRELRVRDIADGLGLSTRQVSKLAGPIEVEACCPYCRTVFTRPQRSRSDEGRRRVCEACVERDRRDALAYTHGTSPVQIVQPPWPGEPLHGYLTRELRGDGCDGTLRLVRAWLDTNARDVDGVLAVVGEWGGFCDCEVLLNVPPDVIPVDRLAGPSAGRHDDDL